MNPRHFSIEVPNKDEPSGSFRADYLLWNQVNSNQTLVCVHGVTRNCHDFDYLAQNLVHSYNLICPDIVGRGQSSWLENKQNYNYGTYCRNIVTILDNHKLSKVDFLGTSMGGIIGMYLAAYYPHLIKRLILNDIGPQIKNSALKKIVEYIEIYPTFSTEDDAEIYLKNLLSPFGIKEQTQWQHLVSHSITRNSDGTYHLNYDPSIALVLKTITIQNSDDFDIWSIWGRITAPTLILRGEKSEILTKEMLKKMTLSRPNVHYFEYSNVGHAPSLMVKDQIDDVAEWLQKQSTTE